MGGFGLQKRNATLLCQQQLMSALLPSVTLPDPGPPCPRSQGECVAFALGGTTRTLRARALSSLVNQEFVLRQRQQQRVARQRDDREVRVEEDGDPQHAVNWAEQRLSRYSTTDRPYVRLPPPSRVFQLFS